MILPSMILLLLRVFAFPAPLRLNSLLRLCPAAFFALRFFSVPRFDPVLARSLLLSRACGVYLSSSCCFGEAASRPRTWNGRATLDGRRKKRKQSINLSCSTSLARIGAAGAFI